MFTIDSRRQQRSRGFTLAEILVAVAVFAIIFIAALALYDRANRVFKKGVEDADVQQTTRVAFDKLVADIRMTGFDHDRDGIPLNTPDLVWAANTAIQSNWVVIPVTPAGRTYRAVAVMGTGTTGATEPSWPVTPGGQVIDNPGINQVTWQEQPGQFRFQQPDEQIEYMARSAITLRGNFNFSSAVGTCPNPNGCDNGRETTYESPAFPVVTTANNEIVTYALVSDNPAMNNDTITFFADVARPRASYPGGAGAGLETLVTIPGVDLTNQNPPYTLYRISLDDAGNLVRSPLSTNLRQMTFAYFADVIGTAALAPLANAPYDASPTGPADLAIGGRGMYNPAAPNNPVAVDYRAVRANVKSIQIGLVGMNPLVDSNYRDAVETSTAPILRNTRKYRLDSLVVPRNIGMSGMREMDVNPPGQPVVLDACVGYCGIASVSWQAAPVNPDQGSADDFDILYDTNPTGAFSAAIASGGGTSGYVYNLDPSVIYYFKVRARNVFGSATSNNMVQVTPTNRTTPSKPTNLAATGGTDATKPAQRNQIELTWEWPLTNVPPSDQITCIPAPGPGGGTSSTGQVLPLEIQGYRVYRSTDPAFATSTMIADENLTGAAAPVTTGSTVTYVDKTVGNCVKYYYKVQAVEFCKLVPAYNIAPAVGISALSGPTAIEGSSKSNAPPAAPATLAVDPAGVCSGSPGNIQCPLNLTWSRVTTDTSTPTAQTITVDRYVIKRVRSLSGLPAPETAAATAPLGSWVNCNTIVTGEPGICREISGFANPPLGLFASTPDTVLKSDLVGTDYRYEFQVAAQQCNPTVPSQIDTGAWSIMRAFPCPLGEPSPAPGYNVNVALPGGYDGDGVTTPWLVTSPSSTPINVTITPSSPSPPDTIVSISALLYIGASLFANLGAVTAPTPVMAASFTIPPGPGDGTVYTIVVTATDSKNCSKTTIRFVEDSPSGCCVVPLSVDSTVVSYVPGNNFVDVTLKNLCSEPLAILLNGLTVSWAIPPATPPGTQARGVDYQQTSSGFGVVAHNFTDSTGNFQSSPQSAAGSAITSIPGRIPVTWAPLTAFALGKLVTPASGNGRSYHVVTAGTSGLTEPAWPNSADVTVSDGTITWREFSRYRIRIRFNNVLVSGTSPLTRVCVTYRRPGVDTIDQNCKIVPAPSATPNSCN